MSNYRSREVPWHSIIRFHKEIVTQAEENFFSLELGESEAERWTELIHFDLDDLAGPWKIDRRCIRSQLFRIAYEQGQHESVFLGGPCFRWSGKLRPLLYREVEIKVHDTYFEVVPRQGEWSVSPFINDLMNRYEFKIDESLDDLATRIIEMSSNYHQAAQGQTTFADTITKVLVSSILPEARDFLIDESRPKPVPWVLFAPPNRFSPLTGFLKRDYKELDERLSREPEQIGGLHVFEDRPTRASDQSIEILPVVPLNESQKHAVKRILERHSLTVISGPPGTGKSQVVVSLLLNAWAHGLKVLFASNNNKAVDVVRERIERFESEFPIAVRAGNREKQNIQEVLRRTLNFIASVARSKEDNSDEIRKEIRELQHRKHEAQELLESKLLQRIDELKTTAIRAYGQYLDTIRTIEEHTRELNATKSQLGLEGKEIGEIEASVQRTEQWLQKISNYNELIRRDVQERQELKVRIEEQERRRNKILEEIDINVTDVTDWYWLHTDQGIESLANWEHRLREMLSSPVEQALEAFEWDDDYNRWSSADDAEQWSTQAQILAKDIVSLCVELEPKLREIDELNETLTAARSRVQSHGIPLDTEISIDVLKEWKKNYIDYKTHKSHWMDNLPWSRYWRLRRKLRSLENQLLRALPLSLLENTTEDTKREQLALIFDEVGKWIELQMRWNSETEQLREIQNRFKELRIRAIGMRLNNIPSSSSIVEWNLVANECERLALLAKRAAHAWRRRIEKEKAEDRLRTIAKEWLQITNGTYIGEVWRQNRGANFDRVMMELGEKQGVDTVNAVRAELRTGKLSHLLRCWKEAWKYEQAAQHFRQKLIAVPEPHERIKSWWEERPSDACVLAYQPSQVLEWPDVENARMTLEEILRWCNRWRNFEEVLKPELITKAQQELQWAIEKLSQAIELIPDEHVRSCLDSILGHIKQEPQAAWPLEKISEQFEEMSPQRLIAEIERIDSQLSRNSFKLAKEQWLQRVRNNSSALSAVDRLERLLRQKKGVIDVSDYRIFQEALPVVPIWITTAHSPQAIPIAPHLFDVVVIDEASQCTLTNVLPLVYRARSLVVLGDDNQLPAIPTIREHAETALAQKYGIVDYIGLFGHTKTNAFAAAMESLPRGRADVLMLTEHFRSNPQIIGFSNRHIYLQRLEIKKDPNRGLRLPFPSGVHVIDVPGTAERGNNERSWVNYPEAEKVIELVQHLKQDSRSFSLGVVTPFTAHKEFLRSRLDQLGLTAEVLVDTANGFQGDERDVMIFSPVVAPGITSSACRWVESPPNLVNVAITRAREALFIVADIEYCLKQEGILRDLALYCKDIQTLRSTSDAELELFSWMLVKGWKPQVHPRVGDIEVDFILQTERGGRIAIEVDGQQHAQTQNVDKGRDAFLQSQGYLVLRIPAREIRETPLEVIHRIEETLNAH